MNTCGTCKYLGEAILIFNDNFEDVPTPFHPCMWIKHNKDFDYHIEANACVVDGSGYHAALCVREDFGCLSWEPKE